MNRDLNELERRCGYTFRDKNLFHRALTHSSYANEHKKDKAVCNERLEFLGDAVLEVVSSDFLYHKYPEKPEGELSKIRASLVCEPTLAYCAADLELGSYLLLGKGEEATGGRERNSVVSDAMEALIGSIYLDGGFANAKEFVKSFILNDLESKQLFYDSKTILQEVVQAAHKEVVYEIIGESGPEHDKDFIASAKVDGMFHVTAKGHTKKHAEQHAAYEALVELKKQGYEFPIRK